MWINIKEKMPPDDQKVLLSHKDNDYPTYFGYYSTKFKAIISCNDGRDMNVTHWMKIPLNIPETRI